INMGGPGGYRTMSEEEMRDLFGNEDPFSDFFKTFFGGGSGSAGQEERTRGRVPRGQQGRDVESEAELTLEEAYHGAMRRVSMTGSVRLKIPETTQPGQVFRLKGHGMPLIGKPDAKGDLYATADIQLPRSLTKDQRQAWEQIRKFESRS